ncbi:MAG: hypothetical protein IT371_29980 [Deltaproteobacteria bacterium]|nr:hypothetical protein [Deltaproteobacteria bacterium]
MRSSITGALGASGAAGLTVVTLIGVALLVIGCATNDPSKMDAAVPHLTDQRTDTARPFSQCQLVPEKACYECGPCDGVTRGAPGVGCKGPGDCVLFCQGCAGAPYRFCDVLGQHQAVGPECKGYSPPRGWLAGCTRLNDAYPPERIRVPSYGCAFCVSTVAAAVCARAETGEVYWFVNSCLPAGYLPTDHAACIAPARDLGVDGGARDAA